MSFLLRRRMMDAVFTPPPVVAGSPDSGETMRPTLPKFWEPADLTASYVTPPTGADGTTASLTLIDYDGTPRTFTGLALATATNRTQLDAALGNNKIIRTAGSFGGDVDLTGLTNCFVWSTTYLGSQANNGNPRGFRLANCNGVGIFGWQVNDADTWGIHQGGAGNYAWSDKSDNLWIQWCQILRPGQEGVKADSGSAVGDAIRTNTNINVRYNEIGNFGATTPRFGEGIYLGAGTQLTENYADGVCAQYNYLYKDDAPWPTGSRQAEVIDVKPNTSDSRIIDNLIVDTACTFHGGIAFWEAASQRSAGDSRVERNRIFGVYGETRLTSTNTDGGEGDNYGTGIFVVHGIPVTDNMIVNCERTPIFVRHAGGTTGNNVMADPNERTVTLDKNIVLGPNTGGCVEMNATAEATINMTNNVMSDNSTTAATGGATLNTSGNTTNVSLAGLTAAGYYDSGDGPGSQVVTLGLVPAGSYWT